MRNDKGTLMDAVEKLRAYHKSNPACFTRSDLNDLETLEHCTRQLVGAAYGGALDDPRHWQSFDRAHALNKKLGRKCSDHECRKKWQEQLLEESKFNPYHKPAGSPEGGQFDFAPGDNGGGLGGGSGGEGVWQETFGSKPAAAEELPHDTIRGRDVSLPPKASNAYSVVRHAADNIADPAKHPHGDKQCGVKVREALEAGGVKIPKELRQNSAKDFGKLLTNPKVGFHSEAGAGQGKGYPPPGYEPRHGDVIVIQPSSSSVHGHTAIYAGRETYTEHGKQKTREIWISDYVQENGPYPNGTYRSEKPSYVIYRHPLLTN